VRDGDSEAIPMTGKHVRAGTKSTRNDGHGAGKRWRTLVVAVVTIAGMLSAAPALATTQHAPKSPTAQASASDRATAASSAWNSRVRAAQGLAADARSRGSVRPAGDAYLQGGVQASARVTVSQPATGATTRRAPSSVDSITGSISGTVTSAAGGALLQGICVSANVVGQMGPPQGGAVTALDGTYTIGDLPVGDYLVAFGSGCGNPGNYASQWYDNQWFQDTASTVPVTGGQTTGSIDAVMQPGGSISGTVTAAGGGALEGICVSATLPDGRGLGGTGAAADGSYTLIGLPTGGYLVNFFANGFCPNGVPANYAGQWYDNQQFQQDASTVSVTAGQTTDSIDAVMQPGGSISGTVTAAGDGPLGGICVKETDPHGYGIAVGATTYDGTYTLSGLATGGYLVNFSSNGYCPNGTPSDYASQWYDGQPLQETASSVPVTAGETIGSIDAVMQPGGSISGTVTAAGDGPLGGICVNVTDPQGYGIAGVATSSDGTYTVSGLPAGSFIVRFEGTGFCPGGTSANVVTQWWDNQPTQETAGTVPVTAGGTTDSIDAVMQPGGSISGTVTEAGDGPLGGICVTAALPDGEGVANVGTDPDGGYTLTGLSAGDYIVSFDSSGYCPNGVPSSFVTQWWDNQSTQETAAIVAVAAGETTGPIDA
jgi:hypothetical protein